MLTFFRKYRLDDLSKVNQPTVSRKNYQIAVIEDNVFPCLEELRKHQFNITVFPDIERLSILADFDIIISDIKGVGKHLGSKLEGAHLIEEIHKLYPNKYLIAYSGSLYNATFNKYFKLCDETKKKAIDVNEWVSTIDLAIESICDPRFQWEKTREILISQKYSIEHISRLEKAYVKTIVKRKDKYLSKEFSNSKPIADSPVVKIAVESISTFAATFISGLVK